MYNHQLYNAFVHSSLANWAVGILDATAFSYSDLKTVYYP
eukprot:gene27640-36379_t